MTVAPEISALARHLPDPIVVADAGCRWGFGSQWDSLVPAVRLFGFDADEAEVERLVEEYADRPHARVTAATLGASPGTAVLLVTKEPGATSLFEPTHPTATHLAPYEGSTVEKTVAVDVVTLDAWAADSSVARIDAMKLDTQGSELDILRGATRALQDVRHLEIEVAFNEIGKGAPLFGEVDGFLRARGFALWRLRDLVHYGLADALDPPSVTEHFWYESRAQAVEMPGGQLVWCNAHFVRRDMYAPAAAPGWVSRLRDACITHVNGLHDLARFSLKRLLEEPVPDALRREVAAILQAGGPTPAEAAPPRALGRAVRRLIR
jgi:FkbM family methyltransferase